MAGNCIPVSPAMFYCCMKGNLMEREIVLHARGECEFTKQDGSAALSLVTLSVQKKIFLLILLIFKNWDGIQGKKKFDWMDIDLPGLSRVLDKTFSLSCAMNLSWDNLLVNQLYSWGTALPWMFTDQVLYNTYHFLVCALCLGEGKLHKALPPFSLTLSQVIRFCVPCKQQGSIWKQRFILDQYYPMCQQLGILEKRLWGSCSLLPLQTKGTISDSCTLSFS